MPAKYLFDTNIYIRCTHDKNFALRYADQYHKLIPFSFFSSVVAHELIVGCFERVNRIVNPTYDDWKVAGQIAVKIVVKRTHLKSKKIALVNDILIALSCRRIGATLITFNLKDFELIRDFVRFSFEEITWE